MSADPRPALALVTPGLARVATLPALFDDHRLVRAADPQLRAVLAWGRKPSAQAAQRFAAAHGVPSWQIEDGFLRSVELGHREPPLSVVVDRLGVYYDATCASELEQLVQAPLDAAQAQRARDLATAWRGGRLSKYNHARERRDLLAPGAVLVIDQTAGDASIAFGLADAGSFARMLEAALDEHPQATIALKVHPDVIAGRKQGHFGALSAGQAARVQLVAQDCHVPALLDAAQAVYTVTSQVGFEALLWGDKPVRCFGMPFYAGWGLTRDEQAAPARRAPAAPEQLVHAALLRYPRYLDPETGLRCEAERLVEWMALQRRQRERFAPAVHALGFSRWKKPIVRAYFGGSEVSFVRREAQVPEGATLAVWGRRPLAGSRHEVVRLEDGFLRSVGLGADLVRPLSWVMDRSGIYYDASAPSELEDLLANARFDGPLLARARALRERIVGAGLSKYNVGTGDWQPPADGRPMVLAVGQVESDASIAWGANALRRNIDLLKAARAARPEAWLVYKPHPDVVARLRRRGEDEDEAHRWCDEIVSDAPIHRLLEAAEEVHVITSLAGFEALLRGRRVHCHGQPFYSGWGLTTDAAPHPRRTRRLSLDELVAATLLLHPTYVSRTTGRFTSAERALDELLQWRTEPTPPTSAWRRAWRFWARWRNR
ncbi:capsular polysaccharide biosynthesis protein [Rivibacter subsaxonicus]|uniref:Capsular polysaccharide export protein n=1 Tax=Rivibacter subsaxonicus TaxID=457575 RepID=A0A4Q7VMS7_9BURK|nr:capsular polysaccharide biosynthesis protein [Rivibacter subsaxonicus]RZT97602.1 capsular polysaccharide export protein [Rivibacter subsaxonicus]